MSGVIPHGVTFDEHLFPGEIEAPVPAVFNYPRFRDQAWAERSNKMVIPSAAPFLYALELMRAQGWTLPEDRAGTIVFPMHSTAVVDTNTRWSRLAGELASLPGPYQPVTVCMHWQDLERKREGEFARKGMRIVSAGHFTDQDFLFRLIHLMSGHRFAASNEVASNLFYALAAGMPYFLVGRPPSMLFVRGNEHMRDDYKINSEDSERRLASIRPLFARPSGEPVLEPTRIQIDLAAEYLRSDQFKTPDELRGDLEYARSLRR
jgi:hypothetical protein